MGSNNILTNFFTIILRHKMKSDVADLPSGKCYAVEGAGQFGWCQVIINTACSAFDLSWDGI